MRECISQTHAVHCMSYLSKAVPKGRFGNRKPNAHTCFGECTSAVSAPKAGVRLGSRCHPHCKVLEVLLTSLGKQGAFSPHTNHLHAQGPFGLINCLSGSPNGSLRPGAAPRKRAECSAPTRSKPDVLPSPVPDARFVVVAVSVCKAFRDAHSFMEGL